MNPIYKSLIDLRNGLIQSLEQLNKDYIRASSIKKGDIEIELDSARSKLAKNLCDIREYENENPDEFLDEIEISPKYQKIARLSEAIQQGSEKKLFRIEKYTNIMLERMKKNEFIQIMEASLSRDPSLWSHIMTMNIEANTIGLDSVTNDWINNSHVYLYCVGQSHIYRKFKKNILIVEQSCFISHLKILIDTIKKQNQKLRIVVPQNREFPLSRNLDGLDRIIEKHRENLVTLPETIANFYKYKNELKQEVEKLIEKLDDTALEALNYAESGGKIIERYEDFEYIKK
jgi:hypothetical protein